MSSKFTVKTVVARLIFEIGVIVKVNSFVSGVVSLPFWPKFSTAKLKLPSTLISD